MCFPRVETAGRLSSFKRRREISRLMFLPPLYGSVRVRLWLVVLDCHRTIPADSIPGLPDGLGCSNAGSVRHTVDFHRCALSSHPQPPDFLYIQECSLFRPQASKLLILTAGSIPASPIGFQWLAQCQAQASLPLRSFPPPLKPERLGELEALAARGFQGAGDLGLLVFFHSADFPPNPFRRPSPIGDTAYFDGGKIKKNASIDQTG